MWTQPSFLIALNFQFENHGQERVMMDFQGAPPHNLNEH
jgi:hypothetical protein